MGSYKLAVMMKEGSLSWLKTTWLIAIFFGVMSVNSGKKETNRSIIPDNEYHILLGQGMLAFAGKS